MGNRIIRRLAALAVCAVLVFSGCIAEAPPQPTVAEPETQPPAAQPIAQPPAQPLSYVQRLAEEAVREIVTPGLSQEEQVRTLYHYLIEHVYFADPVGLDIWRYCDETTSGEAIPYLENRALSPLRFHIGSCEDFAAAMALLLRAAGLEAEYVAGYTLSVDQVYIDHAWAVVRLGGEWYHLDTQLEQNVTRQNRLTYRYYLKSDDDFALDHKWGENLIAYYADISHAEAANIREHYTPPACLASYAAPEAVTIPLPVKPNMADVEAEIRRAKTARGGELPPISLNAEPPVLIAALHITPPLLPQQTQADGFRYGRSQLEGAPAQLYDALSELMQAPADGAETPVPAGMSDEEARAVAGMFLSDHPLAYWADFSVLPGERGRLLRLSMSIAAEEAERRKRLVDERAREILAPVEGGSDFERALAVHDAVATTGYDKDASGRDSANVYGALVEGAATCDGYARAFQYLAEMAGLEAVYIRGRSSTGAPHAWNAVRLDGGWHFVDATWNRPLRDYDDVYHDYFLMDDAAVLAERVPEAGQYPELPQAGEGYRGYFERMGYAVSGPVPPDAADAMAELLYRQLAAKPRQPGEARLVYLEFQVLGDGAAYDAWKQLYIKQVFAVLRAVETRAREEGAPFRVADASSVKCDFNDVTRVLSCYPSVAWMEE